ncbi:sce7725 family protein [Listeria booriae]|uniref:sce7725 family protein n=1 Tax=Listeria booriae TaxID=1552123 RepID=UPI00162A55C2|nr:sce7725 family protein [Listeria booriae]MBC1211712.1 sce7725 family protein [Listeria booriae]MBC6298781.1 sce7725 family protein [Listeria booriae]
MYFPYLRGKQFELLALRELAEKDLIEEGVIFPIIEPLKPTSTLLKTLECFIGKNINIGFITNPMVGNFEEERDKMSPENLEQLNKLMDNNSIVNAHIMNKNSLREIKALGVSKNQLITIFNSKEVNHLATYNTIFSETKPDLSLIPDDSAFRRSVNTNKILFADKFEKKVRNSDYCGVDDEFFSSDHKFFNDEGYKGFSDYSVVGSDFKESGFAPYAVAIHIVYFDEENNLRVKHFVSDSNDDITDPAGKFAEALRKLIAWADTVDVDTYGLNQFKQYYKEQKYPGLGTVKKVSVMHHLELMNQYLLKSRGEKSDML